MVLFIKGSGRKISNTGEVWKLGLMEQVIQVAMRWARNMDKVNLNGQTAQNILVLFNTITSMDMEHTYGQTNENLQAIG